MSDLETEEVLPAEPEAETETEPVVLEEAPPIEPRPPVARETGRSASALDGEDLRVRLNPEVRRLLRLHCHPSGWGMEDLVLELLRQGLSSRMPAVYFGERLLASADVCRFWMRNPRDTTLRLRSDRGTFLITSLPDSACCRQWVQHFTTLGLDNAPTEARQMRLIQLQEAMNSVDDFKPGQWRKEIPVEEYSVMDEVITDRQP